MNDHTIAKLRKLLALSGSDNEHEAALAMSKAEALICKHKLNLTDVAPSGSGAACADAQIEPGSGETFSLWEAKLATVIAWAFHGMVVDISYRFQRGSRVLHFVASKTDLAIICDLFERLRQTVRRKSAAYVRTERTAGRRGGYWVGQSYRVGMVQTISRRLEALRHNTDPDHDLNEHGMSGKELMVIKDRAVEQRFAELFCRPGEDTRKLRVRDLAAYQRGREDGGKVGLHRSMPGTDGPLAIAVYSQSEHLSMTV